MDATELTTIQVSKKTRSRLKKYGQKGDTYDSLLNRFMDWVDTEMLKPFEK